MRVLFIPTRGSDRLLRKERLKKMAQWFDSVLVFARDFKFPEGSLPSNTKVWYTKSLNLAEKRSIGTSWAFDQGADLCYTIDDDVVGDYEYMFARLELAMLRNPFLGSCRAITSTNMFYYGHGKGEPYSGVFEPRIALSAYPSQVYVLRREAYEETEGYYNIRVLEDIDIGAQMVEAAWVNAYLPFAAYTVDRRQYGHGKKRRREVYHQRIKRQTILWQQYC